MTAAVVVLAAGASSRLGSPKALADLGGRSALERLTGAALTVSGGEPVRVVVGAHAAEIPAALPALEGVEWIVCDDWRLGRTASLRTAARTIGPGRDIVVAPVDVPLVAADTFGRLARAWTTAGAPASGWLAPFVETASLESKSTPTGSRARFGHPVVLGADLVRGLEALAEDAPLRALRERAAPLLSVPVRDAAILDDLDTPDDLEALQRRFERQG
ncbi:MAG: NTP transferase domain-containing protein [Planctomycetota bacterium]